MSRAVKDILKYKLHCINATGGNNHDMNMFYSATNFKNQMKYLISISVALYIVINENMGA